MASTPRKNAYSEDIAVVGNGTNIIATPCMVYHITISTDTGATAVLSISDSTTYSAGSRVEKVVVNSSQPTVTLDYDDGKPFFTGLSAISNIAGVDIAVTYE